MSTHVGRVSLRRAPRRSADLRRREQAALELNDTVLQGLVVAKLAFELDEHERGLDALDAAITATSRMITALLDGQTTNSNLLLRSRPAILQDSQ